MGVKGLWKLLQPTSRLVKLDRLEGTKLSVDLSIWLHQAVHARVATSVARSEGPRMHLQVLFHRLLKLLFYGIRAVFVFDGPEVSSLKKRTQLLRRLCLSQATLKSRKAHVKLVKHLAAAASHFNKGTATLAKEKCQSPSVSNNAPSDSPNRKDVSADSHFILEQEEDAEAKSNGESSPGRSPSQTLWNDLDSFDLPSSSSIDPQSLAALPNEMQFQIYASERSAACSLKDLPEDSTDFSAAQMRRLINRSELGEKMSRLRTEIILSDPVIALSLTNGPPNSNLVRLRKMLSRDQKHHVMFEDEATPIQVMEPNDQEPAKRKDADILKPESISSFRMTADQPTTIPVSVEEEQNDNLTGYCVYQQQSVGNIDATTNVRKHSPPPSTSLSYFAKDVLSGEVCTPSEDPLSFEPLRRQVYEDASNIPSSHSTDDSDDFIEVEEPTKPCHESLVLISRPLAAKPSSLECITSTSSDASAESDYEDNVELLRKERVQAEARERGVSSQILDDCEVLIKSFGMPVVKGPAEAEAQCAWLEENHITEGTITDDSDIWLFGGRRVYRNLFNVKKMVEQFDMTTITNLYGLDRERLVLLAMLVGCDYTVGVQGIGAVTATEVIAEFDHTKEEQNVDRLQSLRHFRSWCERIANGDRDDSAEASNRGRLVKLAHCRFPDTFPDQLVFDAFLQPRVDQVDGQTLSWNLPDVDRIRSLMSNWFGWSKEETDRHLLPVVKRAVALQSGRQKRIDGFCNLMGKGLPDSLEAPLSQRLKTATSRLKATVNKRKQRRHPAQTLNVSPMLAGWCPSEAERPKRRRVT
uniref:XPG N-terminal domain-containing protein n=1 Tax=Trichuris muris TaxID=70415 RepID=A0A5S6QX76_TRIMR